MSPNRIAFYFIVAIPLVFSENDPSSLSNVWQPSLIRYSAAKVLAVTSVLNAVGLQGLKDGLAVV